MASSLYDETMFKLYALLIFTIPLSSYAQNMAALLSPHAPDFSFAIEGALYQNQDEWGFLVDQKILKNEKNRFSLSARYQDLSLDHLKELPSEYESFEAGLQYTRYLEDRKFWSIQTRFGSASDKIFDSTEVNTLTTNFLYRASEKWLFLANYSNNRSFLNNIPLPSVMYIHSMSREKVVLLGLPFIFIRSQIAGDFSYTLSSLIPYNHNLALHYQAHRYLEISAGLEQSIQNFLKADRENKKERIYLRRRSAYLDLKSGLSRNLDLHLKTGYAFDHQLSESESYSDKNRKEISLKDGVFSILKIDYRLF